VKPLFSIILSCLTAAGAPPGITVRVVNLANIPRRTVEDAESSAGAIFRAAGLGVIWVNCDGSNACGGQMGPAEFWLQLLDKRPGKLSENVLGFALLTNQPRNDGGYAAVTWQSVRDVVECLNVDTVPVLGVTIAHELGHLLLGSHAHSRDGVMAAHFGRRELGLAAHGGLRFTDAQAKALRRFAATSSP